MKAEKEFRGNKQYVFRKELHAKMNKDYKQTIIMITHNLEIASYADRIITIEDGKIVKEK